MKEWVNGGCEVGAAGADQLDRVGIAQYWDNTTQRESAARSVRQ